MWRAIMQSEVAVVVGVAVFLFGMEGLVGMAGEVWRMLW